MAGRGKAPDMLSVPISSQQEWEKISGEGADKDFLFIVEVYVTWCGPCEAIVSSVKKQLTLYMGRKLKFFTVPVSLSRAQIEQHSLARARAQANADELEDLTKYRTTSKPFFLVFKDGAHERDAVRCTCCAAHTRSAVCVQASRSS